MENFFSVTTLDVGLRLFVALILGMVIGAERVWAHKTAGLRTYALVSMGSALFVIISSEMIKAYSGFSGMNPLVIVAEIVVGVGFLGTGLIFNKDSKVMGLTTATGLWVAAGIGMAAGFALYDIAFIATLLTLFTFTVLWSVEAKIKQSKFVKEDEDDHSNFTI